MIPVGLVDLDQARHGLEARFFARSIFSSSSTGSCSARKSSPTVRTTDFRVQPERPVVEIPEVKLEALWPRDRIAPVYLRPACDPGKDGEPPALARLVGGGLLDEIGARADQAHLPRDDVDELRQLVEPRAPEKAARFA